MKEQLILKCKQVEDNKYSIEFFDYKNNSIAKIDFKNDDDFCNINKINEYILENLYEYSTLNIQLENSEQIFSENDELRLIYESITKLWVEEFNSAKLDLNELINKKHL